MTNKNQKKQLKKVTIQKQKKERTKEEKDEKMKEKNKNTKKLDEKKGRRRGNCQAKQVFANHGDSLTLLRY